MPNDTLPTNPLPNEELIAVTNVEVMPNEVLIGPTRAEVFPTDVLIAFAKAVVMPIDVLYTVERTGILANPKDALENLSKANPKDALVTKLFPTDVLSAVLNVVVIPKEVSVKLCFNTTAPIDVLYIDESIPLLIIPKEALVYGLKPSPKDALENLSKANPKDALDKLSKANPNEALDNLSKANPKEALVNLLKANPKEALVKNAAISEASI
jgi:hypothetical protein